MNPPPQDVPAVPSKASPDSLKKGMSKNILKKSLLQSLLADENGRVEYLVEATTFASVDGSVNVSTELKTHAGLFSSLRTAQKRLRRARFVCGCAHVYTRIRVHVYVGGGQTGE